MAVVYSLVLDKEHLTSIGWVISALLTTPAMRQRFQARVACISDASTDHTSSAAAAALLGSRSKEVVETSATSFRAIAFSELVADDLGSRKRYARARAVHRRITQPLSHLRAAHSSPGGC